MGVGQGLVRSPAGTRCTWSAPDSSHPVERTGAQPRWPRGLRAPCAHQPQQELLLCVSVPLGSESEEMRWRKRGEPGKVGLLLGHT